MATLQAVLLLCIISYCSANPIHSEDYYRAEFREIWNVSDTHNHHKNECHCVQFYDCPNKNPDGTFSKDAYILSINLRFNSPEQECPHYLHKCCPYDPKNEKIPARSTKKKLFKAHNRHHEHHHEHHYEHHHEHNHSKTEHDHGKTEHDHGKTEHVHDHEHHHIKNGSHDAEKPDEHHGHKHNESHHHKKHNISHNEDYQHDYNQYKYSHDQDHCYKHNMKEKYYDNKCCGLRNHKGLNVEIGYNKNEGFSEYAEFPWMVALVKYGSEHHQAELFCGGSLIHPKVVMTTAHCVADYVDKPGKFQVRAGEWDTQTWMEEYKHQERNVTKIIIHPKFEVVHNNIALLFVEKPFELAPNVQPVCLPPQNKVFKEKKCFTMGWGKSEFGSYGKYSVILKKIELPIVDPETCEHQLAVARFGKTFELHESYVCAGGEEGIDACTGDGGSPLVCPVDEHEHQYQLAGMVSWGIGCGQKDVPGVYTNVALFRKWIDEQMDKIGYGTYFYSDFLNLRFGPIEDETEDAEEN